MESCRNQADEHFLEHLRCITCSSRTVVKLQTNITPEKDENRDLCCEKRHVGETLDTFQGLLRLEASREAERINRGNNITYITVNYSSIFPSQLFQLFDT